MSSTTTPEDAAYYKRVLHDLIDIGADLARIVHNQAKREAEHHTQTAPAALPPTANDRTPDPTIAFDRIARAIRRTILLAQHLDKPAANRHRHRIAARKRILRKVEDTIRREAKPGDRPALQAELLDRLDAPDLEDDIDTIPIEDIITDICRDLHLAFQPATWSRRTPQDIATLRNRAAAIPPAWATPTEPLKPHPKPKASARSTPRKYLIRDTG